ncbi:MAG: trimethylamine methyltransferase family protein [Actinomycetota bacterium]|nr:trimethylamine methyltransferase family protein [Actinomycetota bacterium]
MRDRQRAGRRGPHPGAFRTLTNPFAYSEPLRPEQVERLHTASLHLLAHQGMRVLSAAARDTYRRAGCSIDGEVVRFDPELVQSLIASAPAEFVLRARNPARDLRLGGRHVVFSSVGGPAFMSDRHGGRRSGTRAELCDFLRLVHSLPIVHQEGGGAFEALDLPAETRHLDLCLDTIRLTDRNWQATALGRRRAADCIDMAAIALGTDRAGLAERPALLAIVNTNSPLTLDVPMAEGLMELAGAGQAVCVTPFTLAGAMAPATLAGALTLQNAEVLAGVCLTQIVRPGAPVMYGSFTSNVDMRSGSPAFGTPEYMKAAQAGGQLARRYRLPYRSSNATSANTVDAQAAYESVLSLWGAVMGGANLVYHAAGWLEGGLTACFEKAVVDAEVLQTLAEWMQPIVTDDDALGLDAIAAVGHGGHFFGSPHTLARYEHAFYEPLVSDRRNFETWVEAGRPDTAERAAGVWSELLARYEQPPLDPAVEAALIDHVERRKRAIAEEDG